MKTGKRIFRIVALALIQAVFLYSLGGTCAVSAGVDAVFSADALSPRCEINSNDFLRGFLMFSEQLNKNQQGYFSPDKKSGSTGRQKTKGIFSAVINGCMDMFFFFFPHRSIVSRIKENYLGQKINVLDVGTGEGGFVEKFQKLLAEREIYAEVIGIDINPTRISQGLSLGRNIKVCDVRRAEEEFGARSFDIITINAPDRDIKDIIRFCMRLLKDNGMLIVRLHNDMHYQVHFGRQYRENLMKNLQDDFNVESLPGHMPDLPIGEYSVLQTPLIITHKHMENPFLVADAVRENIKNNSRLSQIDLGDVIILTKAEDVGGNRTQQVLESGIFQAEGYLQPVVFREVEKSI